MIESILLLFTVACSWFAGSAVVYWDQATAESPDKHRWRQLTAALMTAALIGAIGARLA